MKKKIGIYGFTGCAGDQLTIIHSEDRLVPFFDKAEIVSFSMATSNNNDEVELDIAFVEGSITTNKQREELLEIRKRSKILVAIGTCACFGGLQSMKLGEKGYRERLERVYGKKKITIGKGTFESEPLNTFVKVEYFIPGCPISADQFFSAFTKLINDFRPTPYSFALCTECKWYENQCLLVEKHLPCLGPVTQAGCGAICPKHGIPCVGCWGPVDEANIASESKLLRDIGLSPEEITRRLRMFGGKTGMELLKKFTKNEKAKKRREAKGKKQ